MRRNTKNERAREWAKGSNWGWLVQSHEGVKLELSLDTLTKLARENNRRLRGAA